MDRQNEFGSERKENEYILKSSTDQWLRLKANYRDGMTCPSMTTTCLFNFKNNMSRHLCVTSKILYGHITMADWSLLAITNRAGTVCQDPGVGHIRGWYIEIYQHKLLYQIFSMISIYKNFLKGQCIKKMTLSSYNAYMITMIILFTYP